jgi:trigger factor
VKREEANDLFFSRFMCHASFVNLKFPTSNLKSPKQKSGKMDLQVEKLDTHEARITISIPDDVVAKARRDVARKLSKQFRIPGFRPGMAPINVVVGTVGQQAFASELADELGNQYYAKAIDEAKVEPYGPGQLEDVKDSPMRLIVRVPLEPEVDLKDYKAIRVPYTAPTLAEEDIESQLQYIREENAVVELAERPAQLGDLVEADIEVSAEGKEVMHNHRPIVLDDEHIPVPGLAQAVAGMSAGEHKDATVTLPDTLEDESLRGKEAQASIDVKRVSNRTLPDINDELAQAAGSFNTLAELRDSIRKQLLDYKTRTAQQQYASQVLDAFAELSTVVYPPVYIEDRLNEMIEDLKANVSRDEHMPFEEWLKMQNKTEAQVREDLRPNAEQRAKKGLVMREVARLENLQVTDSEIGAEVDRTTQMYGGTDSPELRKLLMKEENVRAMQNNILTDKVMDRMAQIARGEADQQPAEPTPTEQVDAPSEPAPASE